MGAMPAAGDAFGRYQITRRLGRGGMGVVYAAQQIGLDREVALKLLSPELADSEEYRARFLREAAVLGRLRSEHIIDVYDVGEHDGWLYIATELIHGGDLQDALRRNGPMPTAGALTLVSEVANGLAAAHEVGVIHRDIKPSNVLLDHGRHGSGAVLCDLGIARVEGGENTMTNGVIGTLGYMAPERHLGQEANVSTDLYAVGCLLWAALTGAAPYVGTDGQVAIAHVQQPVRQLPANHPDARLLNPLLARLMAKDPTLRPFSAAQLHDECDRVRERLRQPGAVFSASGATPGGSTPASGPRTPGSTPVPPFSGPHTPVSGPHPPVSGTHPPAPPAPTGPGTVTGPDAPTSLPGARTGGTGGTGPRPAAAAWMPPPGHSTTPARRSRLVPLLAAAAVLSVIGAASAVAFAGGDDQTQEPGTPGTTPTGVLSGEGELVLAALLPRTGVNADFGPTFQLGVDLAVQDINARGGLFGEPVKLVLGDTGEIESGQAGREAERLLDEEDADALIGPIGNADTDDALEQADRADAALVSPLVAALQVDDEPGADHLFRVGPTDVLEGRAMGKFLQKHNEVSVVVLSTGDAWATTIATTLVTDLEDRSITVDLIDDLDSAADLTPSAWKSLRNDPPYAIVAVDLPWTSSLAGRLDSPAFADTRLLLSSEAGADLGTSGAPGGADAMSPWLSPSGAFAERVLENDGWGTPQAYDATMLTALAAAAAGSADRAAILENLVDVSRGGTRCTSWDRCTALLAEGEDIDYQGVSGSCDLDDDGNPVSATFELTRYDGSGPDSGDTRRIRVP